MLTFKGEAPGLCFRQWAGHGLGQFAFKNGIQALGNAQGDEACPGPQSGQGGKRCSACFPGGPGNDQEVTPGPFVNIRFLDRESLSYVPGFYQSMPGWNPVSRSPGDTDVDPHKPPHQPGAGKQQLPELGKAEGGGQVGPDSRPHHGPRIRMKP